MKEPKPDRNAVARERFARIAEIRRLAGTIPDQDALDVVLMQWPDRTTRLQVFKLMRPFLKFTPQFPEDIVKSDTIVQPNMIVRPN